MQRAIPIQALENSIEHEGVCWSHRIGVVGTWPETNNLMKHVLNPCNDKVSVKTHAFASMWAAGAAIRGNSGAVESKVHRRIEQVQVENVYL